MDPSAQDPLERVRRLDDLLVRTQEDARMEAELARARREFFGGDRPAGDREAATAAWLRFCEWFLIERESENLGTTPVTRFGSSLDDEFLASLQESLAGAFLVESVGEELLRVWDLQTEVRHELLRPGIAVARGDLLIGRLYGGGDGLEASGAMTVFRDAAALAEAFRRDLAGLELDRRLTQCELEHLLLAPGRRPAAPEAGPPADTQPLERLEAALETLLEAAGAPDSAAGISADLARADGPGAVMGPLMERLAFDTDIDLGRLQRLLLEIWNAHRSRGPVAAPAVETPRPPAAGLGAELARTLEEGLARNEDVEVLFRRLADMADCDLDEPESERDESGPASDPDLGDLEALIEEFLWETGAQEEPAAGHLRQWLVLQRTAPVPRTDLEYVTADDLVRLLLHTYLGARPRSRADAVREAFAAVEGFYRWAEATQEFELADRLQAVRATVLDQIGRLHAASLALSTSDRPDPDLQPCLMRVEELADDGFGVRPDAGGDGVWIPAAPAVAGSLRVGDLVLGALQRHAPPEGSLAGMVVVLPEEAESLVR